MKLGLHSMSYAGMWGGATLEVEDVLDTAAELGFDGVMLMAKRPHASPLDLPQDRVKRLKHHLELLWRRTTTLPRGSVPTPARSIPRGSRSPSYRSCTFATARSSHTTWVHPTCGSSPDTSARA